MTPPRDGKVSPFAGMTHGQARMVIRDNLALILGNNVSETARRAPSAMGPLDVVVNLHLVDRVGAILNACRALGYRFSGRDHTAIYVDLEPTTPNPEEPTS